MRQRKIKGLAQGLWEDMLELGAELGFPVAVLQHPSHPGTRGDALKLREGRDGWDIGQELFPGSW